MDEGWRKLLWKAREKLGGARRYKVSREKERKRQKISAPIEGYR